MFSSVSKLKFRSECSWVLEIPYYSMDNQLNHTIRFEKKNLSTRQCLATRFCQLFLTRFLTTRKKILVKCKVLPESGMKPSLMVNPNNTSGGKFRMQITGLVKKVLLEIGNKFGISDFLSTIMPILKNFQNCSP